MGPAPRGRAARPTWGHGPAGATSRGLASMARALDRGARGCKRGGLYRPGGGSRARFWGPTCMKEARFGREQKWPLDDIFLESNFVLAISKNIASGGHFFSRLKRASFIQVGPQTRARGHSLGRFNRPVCAPPCPGLEPRPQYQGQSPWAQRQEAARHGTREAMGQLARHLEG